MTQESFQLTSAAISDRGLSEKRPHNEDSYLELPARGLFAVADGVGGAQAGDVASQMAVEILAEAFANLREGGDTEELMKIAIERANSAVFQMAQDLPQLSTMATTVVALHLNGNIATIGHVGDSRLYRLDSLGHLFRETQDHSVVEEEVRAGRMTPAQAASHPSRNVISRAIGAESDVEVDMKTIMIDPNTTFLLCSDGITRHIEDHEIRELLMTISNPADVCARMKEICYSRGAEDNLTAVIVKIGAVGAANGIPADYEEATVATARTAAASTSGAAFTADNFDDDLEIPTQNLRTPPAAQNLAPAENIQSFAAPATQPNAFETTSETINVPTNEPVARDEKIYTVDEKSGGNFLTKLFSAMLLLFLGGIVGALLYYFAQRAMTPAPVAQEPPRITQMQTPNIEYSAFEESRRSVDKNPPQYLEASGGSAQSAEDFYLLGRAHFLTGDYVKAKESFTKAKELLPETKEVNRRTLENEVALMSAIVENVIARNEFINQKRLINAGTANPANTSVNQ
jgi:serine/threonine protein phosphatase PrpC